MRRHDGCGNAQLTLDVQAEAVGRLLVAECADADPIPGPLGAEVCLRHVRLEASAARASFQSDGGTTIGCRAGGATTDAVRTGSGFSTRSWTFSAGATLTLPSAGGALREGTA